MSRWIVVSLLVVAVAVAGCGDDGDEPTRTSAAGPTATATPTATAEPEPTPPPQPPGRRVRFRASDGVSLRGTLTPAAGGKRAPAILLAHQRGGDAKQWDPLIPDLHAAGFTTLAYDSRDPSELDEQVLRRDAAGAIAFLRRQSDVHRDRLGIVGASIGAATAVLAIGTQQRKLLDAAVAMSPADSPLFIELATEGRFHPHDVLFVADARERINSDNLAPDAKRSRVYESAGPGHGIELLPDAAVRKEIVDWLKERVG